MSVTTQNVKDMFLDKITAKQFTLLELYNEHNRDMIKKVGKSIVEATYRKHVVTVVQLKEFMLSEYDRWDMNLSEINGIFIDKFFTFLLAKLQNNTAVGSMKRLKSVLRIALDNNYTDVNAFKNFRMKLEKIDIPYLTERELKTIISKDFGCERLNKIREVFVFNSLTGLAFSDSKDFTKEFIVVDNNGDKWINKNRNKTKVLARIPLLPLAECILEKYNYQLPVPSNVKMNAYLKEIGDICGIEKKLCTHVARHTAATLFLNNGISLDSVAAILGHTNTKITQRYAKLLDTTIMGEMKNMKLKFAV